MRSPHRGVIVLLSAFIGLAGLGIVAIGLGTESVAAEVETATAAAGEEPAPELETGGPAAEMTPATGPRRDGERAALVDAVASRSDRTSGLIRGDVTLTASAVDKIRNITIRVVEAVRDPSDGRPPFTRQLNIPFDPRDGTPKFTLDEIPFSEFGYAVQAFAAGLNGTEQVVQVNERTPIADVVLGIHPGVPFSLLLRDQDLTPLGGVEVTLTPHEGPPGRQAYYKVTDSFGAAVWPDVLRGTYLVQIGPAGQTIHPTEQIEVMANSGMQVQSKTIVVPKGDSLTVNVYNALGHGVADIEVKLSSGSDVRYREVKQKTDWSGRTTFAHLAPGSYWVNVLDPRYQPRTVPGVVRAGEKPKEVDIHLRAR